jgi:hypothetical protein
LPERYGRESEVVVDGFTIGRDDVLRWIDRHDAAWRAADPAAIAELFSAEAVYHLGPWDAPWRGLDGPFRGRDAIAEGWLAGGIEGERFRADSEILAIEGGPRRRRITTRRTARSRAVRHLLGRRAEDGRVLHYQEWYVKGP